MVPPNLLYGGLPGLFLTMLFLQGLGFSSGFRGLGFSSCGGFHSSESFFRRPQNFGSIGVFTATTMNAYMLPKKP